uniref:Uncharacterized protein 49D11.19 n=1 Tax=Oryza sativa subsp. japonica TaxID=39947 RepID=Q8S3R3_ORYSJ|nr:hypothetical protein [Oryza sativa Japonica Group]
MAHVLSSAQGQASRPAQKSALGRATGDTEIGQRGREQWRLLWRFLESSGAAGDLALDCEPRRAIRRTAIGPSWHPCYGPSSS